MLLHIPDHLYPMPRGASDWFGWVESGREAFDGGWLTWDGVMSMPAAGRFVLSRAWRRREDEGEAKPCPTVDVAERFKAHKEQAGKR